MIFTIFIIKPWLALLVCITYLLLLTIHLSKSVFVYYISNFDDKLYSKPVGKYFELRVHCICWYQETSAVWYMSFQLAHLLTLYKRRQILTGTLLQSSLIRKVKIVQRHWTLKYNDLVDTRYACHSGYLW